MGEIPSPSILRDTITESKLVEIVGPAGRIVVKREAFEQSYKAKGYELWTPKKAKAKKDK